jgi:3-dehydroquinate dehydratase II
MKVLIIHGPNLNLLGQREPDVYGSLTLDEVNARIAEHAAKLGITTEATQSNDEGELINIIQSAPQRFDALVINAGGYSHTSVAIRDAIAGVGITAIAVHISNPHARETFRHTDLVAGACRGVVAGFGWRSYTTALDLLARPSGQD